MSPRYLSGTGIYLRPIERGDAPHLVEWLNDPEITRRLDHWRPLNLAAEEAFIAKLYESPADLVLGITLAASDQLIGATGLHQIDFQHRSARFGIFIGYKEHWGKGFGTEATRLMVRHAFETMNLHRIWLEAFEDNQRGIRSYERVGFQTEGMLRDARFREGRYWNLRLMAIVQS